MVNRGSITSILYREELHQEWKRTVKPLMAHRAKDDITLSAKVGQHGTFTKVRGFRYFKGTCRHCGKEGHKKMHCPQIQNGVSRGSNERERGERHNNNNNANNPNAGDWRSRLECWKCGKKGHLKRDCRQGGNNPNNGRFNRDNRHRNEAPEAAFVGCVEIGGDDGWIKVGDKKRDKKIIVNTWADICDESDSENEHDQVMAVDDDEISLPTRVGRYILDHASDDEKMDCDIVMMGHLAVIMGDLDEDEDEDDDDDDDDSWLPPLSDDENEEHDIVMMGYEAEVEQDEYDSDDDSDDDSIPPLLHRTSYRNVRQR
jgi:hypothetical protein